MASVFAMFVSVVALGYAAQPAAGQGEFVPATGPLTEQLPAAPLLIAAYAFVWIAVLLYVWTLWRRLNKVEADMHALEQRQRQHR
jgi:CcmD family protein